MLIRNVRSQLKAFRRTAPQTLAMMSCLLLGSPTATVYAQEGEVVKSQRFEPIYESRSRIVPVKVYASEHGAPQPIVLFSHGLGGSRENSAYLGKHWAAFGYVVVAMQHAGSDQEVWKSVPIGRRMSALKAATGARALLDRLADVSFVIDQLEKWNADVEHPLHERLDLDQIGMSGHSFGAATTMGVAGRRYPRGRSFTENRIGAFFAMSPQASKNGYSSENAFGHIKKPILCMTGTEDGSPIDPSVSPESRQKVFTALPKGDKYQLVLEGAQHSAFGDSLGKARTRNPKHHPAIKEISLKFWDAYLKGDSDAQQWLQSNAPIEKTTLSTEDTWKWK